MNRAQRVAALGVALLTPGLASRGSRPLELRTAPGHPLRYYVSRPPRWSPDRSWPAIVVVTDAYRDFAGAESLFARTPGAEAFVIATPLVLSGGGTAQAHRDDFDYDAAAWARAGRDGNCRFDDDGLQAMLEDLRRRDHVGPVFLTGWEAGGHVVLSQVLNHPERWAGAAAATPNYQGRCTGPAAPPEDSGARHLPIRQFRGSRDTATGPLSGQWGRFERIARSRGFTDVATVRVPGGVHGPLATAIVSYFGSLRR